MMQHLCDTDLWCQKGHLNRQQADKLISLCEYLRPQYAIEIGFCTGRSAACVLWAAGAALRRMISVDHNLDYLMPEGRQMVALLATRYPHFSIVEKPSREVLSAKYLRGEFPSGINWATIDGAHSYDGCMFDLSAISPFMNAGGIMVVDDYRSGPPNGVRYDSVTKCVNDFLSREYRRFEGTPWHCEGKGMCIISCKATA